jgi:hypothetical protein
MTVVSSPHGRKAVFCSPRFDGRERVHFRNKAAPEMNCPNLRPIENMIGQPILQVSEGGSALEIPKYGIFGEFRDSLRVS